MIRKEAPGQSDEDKHVLEALQGTVARRTVAIVFRDGLKVGSGVCLKHKNEYFVVTAAHVVEGKHPQDIYFIALPDAPLATTPSRMEFSEGFLPPIADITISAHSPDDLALLRLCFLPPEMRHMEFYEPEPQDRAAPVRKQVILHGFPGESGRIIMMEGETAGAVFPYFDYPPVTRVTKEVTGHLRQGILQYRPPIHFLFGVPFTPAG